MAFIPASNSVVAFQSKPSSLLAGVSVMGTVPVTQTTTPWVVNMPSSSVVAYQLAGSILAVSGSFTSGNTSVTAFQGGAWTVSVVGNMNSSVTAYQGGAWSTSVTGGYVNVIGSVLVTGSVASYQGTDPWKVNVPTSSYLSYQLAGSIMAVSGSFSGGNSSVQLLGSQAVIGSVTVLQGTNPWQVNVPTSSYIAYQLAGSIMAVSATVNTGNSSVQLLGGVATIGSVVGIQGTNPYIMTGSVQGVMSVLGTVPVTQATTPWIVNVPTSSYISYQLAGSIMAVSATVNTGNSSVQLLGGVAAIGSVATLQGTNPWIVQSIGSVAVAINNTNTSIFTVMQGSVAVMQGTSPWVVGSVIATIQGSVAAAVTNFTASVAANINVISASIITNQGTNPWVIGSIVGTYQEDSPHTSTDRGVFMLHVRNDTLSSVTSTDGDYSTNAVGPAGETVVANSPITKWVVGRGSVMLGASVQVLAAPGASIFSYITGINIINESALASRVTLTQGLGGNVASVLTWVIAPATGGSNATYINPIRVLDNNGISASVSTAASVYVTITGFTAKT